MYIDVDEVNIDGVVELLFSFYEGTSTDGDGVVLNHYKTQVTHRVHGYINETIRISTTSEHDAVNAHLGLLYVLMSHTWREAFDLYSNLRRK